MANQHEQTLLQRNAELEKELAGKTIELERKNRELEIEASLDRVRAQAMFMKKPDELLHICKILFDELQTLGFRELRNTMININHDDKTYFLNYDYSKLAGPTINRFSYDSNLVIQSYLQKLGNSAGEFVENIVTGDALKNWKEFLVKNGEQPDPTLNRVTAIYYYFYSISTGALGIGNYKSLNKEQLEILKRFRNVFDLAYRRYIDIGHAEEQARQAQIEVSLEHVRTKAMAMQKSDDLAKTVATVFEELDKLSLGTLRVGIGILNKEKCSADVWTTTKSENETVVQVSGDEPMNIHPLLQGAFDAWTEQEEDSAYTLQGEDLLRFYKALNRTNFKLPESQSITSASEDLVQYYYVAILKVGGLYAFRETPFPDEAKAIMKRFADVVDLTYTRFLDLQKAEAQTKEAKIELALEKVRARAMAMKNSDELNELVAILFDELVKLDLVLTRCIIWIFDPVSQSSRIWMANSEDNRSAESYLIKKIDHPYYKSILEGWKEKKSKWEYDLKGKEKRSIDELLLHETELSRLPESVKKGILSSEETFVSGSFNNFGLIEASGPQRHSDEQLEILNRFGKVFDLTYTRFLDLKQAEAQAREAKIEAALEKVRSKAMAMQNSTDLSTTASTVFTELRKLGIRPIRCGVGLLSKESVKAQLYSAISSETGDSLALAGWVQLKDHPVLENIYLSWVNSEEYCPVLSGEELKSYYQLLLSGLSIPSVPDWEDGKKQFGHFIPVSIGCLYAWSDVRYDDEEIQILKRFATIIDLTFRRYMELQQSEINARETLRQAALDRLRAEIASMRTTVDLEKITPLIWNELTILGVPFIRCGVFIMDDEQELIHSFLSTPDGKAIAAFNMPYTEPGNFQKILINWRQNRSYTDHWTEKDFEGLASTLLKQGSITSELEYLSAIPHGGFYLHFLPFLQGMLYVGNSEFFDETTIKLVQSIADAFSTAYARYEDFNRLEAAKKQVEKTLMDLKQAQTQLVQAEKMASLGELTAGIAHEIQNPLNFVNNFSEVSSELLDEMKSELERGDKNEVIAIVGNLQQNLEKILHHGKRADSIVKGMLQHSRVSAGQKEPTDINALVDEYLRLSYHGLRAKDKNFNATIKVEFDKSIGKINVVPQDIGRMLLNIYNNAFFAVSKKKSSSELSATLGRYEPTVSVATKKLGNKVLISIEDNGTGIPQKILDKIFQPFFTTKPTGQGTGLGLSLAYDIVKSHGGEIKVKNVEGEGAAFVIELVTE